MTLGPFITYAPPGPYTKTLTDAAVTNLVGTVRLPVYIGVGQEELEQLDLEVVRGSSSTQDQQIVSEDVSQSFVVDDTNPANPVLGPPDGSTRAKFRVRHFPIVDGQGIGRVTNDTRTVSCTVDGVPVSVGSVQGQDGYVTLQVPPQATSDIRCTYFFHRSDTSFTDDVSAQVTSDFASLTSPGFEPFNMTSGSIDTLIILVNGATWTVTFPTGAYTAASLKSVIDASLITGLSTTVFADNDGKNHITFSATSEIEIGDGSANGPLGFTSGQKTNRNVNFRVFNIPIVDGSSGGITTTDPSKVVAKVNGVQVIPTAVDGRNGVVTLASPPAPGATVVLTYWANTWQDTFDYLPNTLVTNVLRCGISPSRNDYLEGQDFVVSNPSPDVSIINWGTSYTVSSTTRSAGAEPFDETQIIPTLVDDKWYLAECDRVVDTTAIPAVQSPNQFLLPAVPTLGNGRDTPLGQTLYNQIANNRYALESNRPDLVVVRVGHDLRDALNRNPATVVAVDAETRTITLKDSVRPDFLAFATFYYNRIQDDSFLLTNKVAGPVGAGQYEVYSNALDRNLLQVTLGTKGGGLTETINWPRGVEQIPDAFHDGGTPVSEITTVTFGQSTPKNALYTTTGAQPWSFYLASATWNTTLNGNAHATNLLTAVRGTMVGTAVTPIQTGVDLGDISVIAGAEQLELEIDGETVSVTLTLGNQTPAFIAAEINAVIDVVPAFAGTAPNNLCAALQVGGAGTGDVFFTIQSYSVPAAIPGGFDANSYVRVMQGTAEATLGLSTFNRVDGTTGAINKPATMISSNAGPFNITAGLNDELSFRLDGVDYTVTLPSGAAVTTAAIAIVVNAYPGLTGVASAGTLANLNMLRLTSTINTEVSSLVILGGSCNTVLGFNQNDSASQTRVDIEEVVNSLMATAGLTVDGLAYSSMIDGQVYLTIESLTTGATTSSVAFTTSSAFNTTTGTEIIAGTSGDIGEDAYDMYTVSSNNASGSGGTGIPGQTYTDSNTGLRFSILPATDGSYATGGWFQLHVSPTFVVNSAVPTYAMGGLETVVANTINVGVDDTATLQTFNPGGLEPAVGDFYYISYRYLKQDFTTRIYRKWKSIEANYGPVNSENRLSLAAYLSLLNGALLVGMKQVLKVTNTNQASDSDFLNAIKELETPLPGNIRPDILVPLATSSTVYAYLMQHCEQMSNIRNQGERMGFIGFASGTEPTSAQTVARNLVSNRIVAFYPDSSVITLTNELGESYEQLVDGTFFAAAVAGAVVNPSIDVATPYTRRRILGFTRISRILDTVEANQTAVAGVTILEDLDPIVRIRQGFTTNMSTILTRLPTITQIADYVQQGSRSVLDAFVGIKFLNQRTNDVVITMSSFFKAQIDAEIVAAYTGFSAEVDEEDPTILRAEAYYQPIFPLLYLVVTFNLRARL